MRSRTYSGLAAGQQGRNENPALTAELGNLKSDGAIVSPTNFTVSATYIYGKVVQALCQRAHRK
jgi:hypothetical protein